MIADKKLKPYEIPARSARILKVAIELEGNMLDIHSRAIAKKMPKDVSHFTVLDNIRALMDSGLLERTGKDSDSLPYYRVTQAGYARAGVKPPLWVA